jgi:hypothetical protein
MGANARFLSILVFLAACGDDGGGDDAGPPIGGTVVLGTGTTEFEEIVPEMELGLVSGPQGGHHFIVHARMSGLVPGDPSSPGEIGNPSTVFTVSSESGERLDVDMAPYRLGYEEIGEDDYVLPGGRIIQVREDAVDDIVGARVLIGVTVTDARDRIAVDERAVNAFLIPLDGATPDAAP